VVHGSGKSINALRYLLLQHQHRILTDVVLVLVVVYTQDHIPIAQITAQDLLGVYRVAQAQILKLINSVEQTTYPNEYGAVLSGEAFWLDPIKVQEIGPHSKL
jgi:hypothetical protein